MEKTVLNPELQAVSSNADTIREACNINYWGMNYYNVDENGEIYVCPNPEKPNSSGGR